MHRCPPDRANHNLFVSEDDGLSMADTTNVDLLMRVTRYLIRLKDSIGTVSSDDIEAWKTFYPQYERIISEFSKRHVRRLGLPTHWGADIDQNVWQYVVTRLRRFQHDGRPRGFRIWLETITKHAAITQVRKLRGRKRGKPRERTGNSSALRRQLDHRGEDPAQRYERIWNEAIVRVAYQELKNELSAPDCEILRRCHVEGESVVMVAFDLNLKPNTVSKRKERMLKRLREILRALIAPQP